MALQQQRGSPTVRSSIGSVTTLSNLLRMLFSRAGEYPRNLPLLYAESFSPNTPEGACPNCHGIGRVHAVDERSLVPDDTLTIRERAVAAWPSAWQGQNLRDKRRRWHAATNALSFVLTSFRARAKCQRTSFARVSLRETLDVPEKKELSEPGVRSRPAVTLGQS